MVGPYVPKSSDVRDDQDQIPSDDSRPLEIDEELLRAIFSLESGYQDLKISNDDSGPVCSVKFDNTVSAFRAAYKLNHRPMPDPDTTRLSIHFSGRLLSVRMATGPPLDLPLLDAVEQYPHTPSALFLAASEEYQDHEQTDQTWWATEPYTHGSA